MEFGGDSMLSEGGAIGEPRSTIVPSLQLGFSSSRKDSLSDSLYLYSSSFKGLSFSGFYHQSFLKVHTTMVQEGSVKFIFEILKILVKNKKFQNRFIIFAKKNIQYIYSPRNYYAAPPFFCD